MLDPIEVTNAMPNACQIVRFSPLLKEYTNKPINEAHKNKITSTRCTVGTLFSEDRSLVLLIPLYTCNQKNKLSRVRSWPNNPGHPLDTRYPL